MTRQGQAFARVVNGSQLLYPNIWTDSQFSRSYNLSFKFVSPYGDKESIFRYVYVPFISLLALALPRQDSTVGYGQPFYVKVNCPGWFESSMGYISSIDFTRGGSDNLWSVDNLPMAIDVTMSLVDCYPSLPMTRKYSQMKYNFGLASFLDTLAGIRSDQLDLLFSAKNWIKRRLSVPKAFVKGVSNYKSDFFTNLQSTINGKIR